MALRRALLATCLVTLTLACGGTTLEEDLAALEASYHDGDYAAVEADAPKVIERAAAESAPASRLWKAEKLKLQAIARQGKGEAAAAELERLSVAYPDNVNAPLYVTICAFVKDTPGAPTAVVESVAVIDAGIKKYPEHRANFEAVIEQIKASGSAEGMEALAQLGYL